MIQRKKNPFANCKNNLLKKKFYNNNYFEKK
jgi:hypothetical protein